MKYALLREFPLLEAALRDRGWQRTFEDDWNLFWGWCHPERGSNAEGVRRANHFAGSRPLHRKDVQATMLRSTPGTAFAGVHGVLVPQTFLLPEDRAALVQAAADDPAAIWISKPLDGSCGRGIRLLAPGEEIPQEEDCLVQRYMDRPHLIGGHRYTLRVWTALLSLDPYILYICRQGLVKRAAHRYATDSASMTDPVVHLTNSDVQRHASNGFLPLLSLDDFHALVQQEGHDDRSVWESIRTACVRTSLLARQTLQNASADNVEGVVPFELFGFDIMMDSDLRPWVIEMNRNPDMRAVWGKSDAESAIKHEVLGDLLDLVFPEGEDAVIPATCGAWELLFPHAAADGWKEDWLPTDHDRAAFASLGLMPPETCRHQLLRHARFVDDGAIFFSPGRREFLIMNDTAAMLALQNDEGEPATPETLPLIQDIWGFVAFTAPPSPDMRGLTRTAPAEMPQEAEYFWIGSVAICCAVPRIAQALRRLLPSSSSSAKALETIYVTASAERVSIISRLEPVRCREALALGRIFSIAADLLSDRAECLAHFPGAAIRFGNSSVLLCGLPFRGKSTLAAALVLSGAELLSDEMVQVDANGCALPLPSPLSLREESRKLLRSWFDAHPEKLTPDPDEDEEARLFFAPVASSPAPIRAFLFLRLRPGEETRLVPIGVCDALQRLRESGLRMPNATTVAHGTAFLDILAQSHVMELTIGSLQEAAAVVQKLAMEALVAQTV